MGFRGRAERNDALGTAERAGYANAPMKWAACDHGRGLRQRFRMPESR